VPRHLSRAGPGTAAKDTAGMRAKLKRLAARQILRRYAVLSGMRAKGSQMIWQF